MRKTKITTSLALAICLYWLAPLSVAAEIVQSFASPTTQAQLVELYTSQGCSSCPPADRWLSKYSKSDQLWQAVVPIAYHVDYWDYLGWKDPFAVAAHGLRQRQAARRADSGTYTPGVFRNQHEWRSWRRPDAWHAKAAPTAKTVGVLTGNLRAQQLSVRFTPADNLSLNGAQLEVVTLRSGQTTKVRAGENRGRALEHNFIAGPVQKTPLAWVDGGWTGQLKPQLNADSSALAFWVVDKQGNYIQATGGWLAAEG